MPHPLPFPAQWSTPLRSTAAGQQGGSTGGSTPSLISAVAAVVAIAAERSHAAGDLATLRAAIEAVLEDVAR